MSRLKVAYIGAPEKIYVADTTFPDYVDFDGSPINTKRIDEHDIEYIRSDVFIEKVAKWFDEHFMNRLEWEIATYEFKDIQSLKEDFKNTINL